MARQASEIATYTTSVNTSDLIEQNDGLTWQSARSWANGGVETRVFIHPGSSLRCQRNKDYDWEPEFASWHGKDDGRATPLLFSS